MQDSCHSMTEDPFLPSEKEGSAAGWVNLLLDLINTSIHQQLLLSTWAAISHWPWVLRPKVILLVPLFLPFLLGWLDPHSRAIR